MQPIVMVPNATGSGHNMRALALTKALHALDPTREIIVLLGSMQNVFEPLFSSTDAKVISTEDRVVDHAKNSHLDKILDKKYFVDGYIAPTFFNGSRMIDYLAYFNEINPAVVVSDYNLTASAAAVIGGYRHVLVTERYDFSLVQLSNDDFRNAGFVVNEPEINRVRPVLTQIFDWLIRNSELILTDKPPLPDLDNETALFSHFSESKIKFIGLMTRPTPTNVDQNQVRHQLGLGSGPLLVASVGGTTMFMESKNRVIETYREAFTRLRKDHPDAEMILIGRGAAGTDDPGVHTLDYIPDWMPLLTCCSALISQPGWITVTEIAALGIPAIFVPGGRGEYHEIEALRRLDALGFPTSVEPTPEVLHAMMEDAIMGGLTDRCAMALNSLAPNRGCATEAAAELIAQVAR